MHFGMYSRITTNENFRKDPATTEERMMELSVGDSGRPDMDCEVTLGQVKPLPLLLFPSSCDPKPIFPIFVCKEHNIYRQILNG
jgi:hypothetical protein